MTKLKLNVEQVIIEKAAIKDGWYVATYDSPFDRLINVRTTGYGRKEMFVLGANDIIQHYEHLDFTVYRDWRLVEEITVEIK